MNLNKVACSKCFLIHVTARLRKGLVSDWQANGNSRPLGDVRAEVWQEAALQLLAALDQIDADFEGLDPSKPADCRGDSIPLEHPEG